MALPPGVTASDFNSANPDNAIGIGTDPGLWLSPAGLAVPSVSETLDGLQLVYDGRPPNRKQKITFSAASSVHDLKQDLLFSMGNSMIKNYSVRGGDSTGPVVGWHEVHLHTRNMSARADSHGFSGQGSGTTYFRIRADLDKIFRTEPRPTSYPFRGMSVVYEFDSFYEPAYNNYAGGWWVELETGCNPPAYDENDRGDSMFANGSGYPASYKPFNWAKDTADFAPKQSGVASYYVEDFFSFGDVGSVMIAVDWDTVVQGHISIRIYNVSTGSAWSVGYWDVIEATIPIAGLGYGQSDIMYQANENSFDSDKFREAAMRMGQGGKVLFDLWKNNHWFD